MQFLEDDLYSYVAYETLKAQSQQVLEDFLVRNDIAPEGWHLATNEEFVKLFKQI